MEGNWERLDRVPHFINIVWNASMSYEFTDLQADTFYEVEISARNALAWSDPTHFSFHTSQGN